ncbi:YXWGXW repeat-containing protein [Paracidovorax anthurii]|uniref:YXWGXW repeat-containing protein n=1 Tax=Paracidovorax anthurii TaxID=78229 RepID=A0A328ZU82_9BURK|nr:YXWGXW repeat-containing protein [Paracidovorax anthurii]RAR85806.1 YXWGXW repeat-containing protein [Paracidovorax anthurii]WCM92636.1 YXWGXW repeat-containing protein [Acidovorax sp. NCPPB 2350]
MSFFLSHERSRAAGALAALAAAVTLSGCVVAPPARQVVVEQGPMVVAPVAPPAPYVETVTVAPSPVHVWVGGFWEWGGSRYAWRPGYWAAPPRPGAVWVPHHWEPGPGGWRMRPGHWGPR